MPGRRSRPSGAATHAPPVKSATKMAVNPPPSFAGRRIIDVHSHVNYHGYSVDDAVRNMDALGIERAWLLTWEAPQDEDGSGDHRYLSPDPYSSCDASHAQSHPRSRPSASLLRPDPKGTRLN